jgi:hypothetical protein
MNFHEHPSNGSQDTVEKACCCSCEVSVIIDQSEKNYLFSRACVRGTNFEKNPSNGRRDAVEKYYVPFITLVNKI